MEILNICTLVGVFLLGGYSHLRAYKQGLELNIKLRTEEPKDIKVNKEMPKLDIVNLFASKEQSENLPGVKTNNNDLVDEWLNGIKESR